MIRSVCIFNQTMYMISKTMTTHNTITILIELHLSFKKNQLLSTRPDVHILFPVQLFLNALCYEQNESKGREYPLAYPFFLCEESK